jgi:hypothetical protein
LQSSHDGPPLDEFVVRLSWSGSGSTYLIRRRLHSTSYHFLRRDAARRRETLLLEELWVMTIRSDQAPVISTRTCFSAEALAARTATADFIALSPPPRMAPPVLTAAQNSAISFLYEIPLST